MRRAAVVVVLLALALAGCSSGSAYVGRGREDSWRQVADPLFVADASYGVAGLVAPGDGYGAWTAVGSVRDAGLATLHRAAVWSSSPDGSRWARVELDQRGARDSVASAGARRQGLEVVVGSVTTSLGDHDARMWASRDGSSWSALPFDGGPGDQSLTSVAAGPLGFVAAGVDRQADHAVPMVWWSADGWSWSRAGLGPGSPFQPNQSISSLAVGPAGAVAVGTLDTSGDTDATAWFSADGTTWRTVPLGAAGFTGPAAQAVRSVTAMTDGFVAVGDDANAERRVAVVWTSADGVTWRRQPPAPEMGELPTGQSTYGVSGRGIAGAGPLVAVGGGYELQVWTSPDGRRWTREEAPVQSVVRDEEALVATDGHAMLIFTGPSGLWFRMPGAPWSKVSADSALFPRPSHSSSITSLVRSGDRLVAFGSEGGDVARWISSDGGRSWERRPDLEGVFTDARVDRLTSTGDLLVAVGLAPTPAKATGAGVWTSADHGSTWERAGAANPAFSIRTVTQMYSVAAGGPGLVAVGLTYQNEVDAQAWFSADGRTWQRASEPPAWSGPGDQLLDDVCGLPNGGLLALGSTTLRGVRQTWAWVSGDGRTWERVAGDASPALRNPGQASVADCVSTPSGVLVTGQVAGAKGWDGALWRTVDGRDWAEVGAPETFASAERDGLVGVAVDGPRIVVTGYEGSDLVVYISPDSGSSWEKRTSAGFEELRGWNLAILGEEVVVAGYGGSAAAVWIGPAP